ncbi:MAG: nucleoside deaminase [Burkholderiaceae bacterium]|jgi:tRNA(Arg) A34 adenosine deaminase TadA|nr:nucleoside deaminase [Burkholderiaceae bacterium]
MDSTVCLPAEARLAEPDGMYLRRAIALADRARARGNRPFGALIVDAGGQVIAEACNANGESGDCTAHAELSAIRLASPLHDRQALAGATLYSSAEPCVMCAGAIFWSAIGRVVYGIDAVRLRAFRGERLDQKDAELSCRDVFDTASHAIECIGPALIAEASASHQGAWKS